MPCRCSCVLIPRLLHNLQQQHLHNLPPQQHRQAKLCNDHVSALCHLYVQPASMSITTCPTAWATGKCGTLKSCNIPHQPRLARRSSGKTRASWWMTGDICYQVRFIDACCNAAAASDAAGSSAQLRPCCKARQLLTQLAGHVLLMACRCEEGEQLLPHQALSE